MLGKEHLRGNKSGPKEKVERMDQGVIRKANRMGLASYWTLVKKRTHYLRAVGLLLV